jgi:acetoin utilization protein AcuB
MLRVRDLMQTQVTTLNVADTLDLPEDVVHLGRARHFPVVSGDHVAGVLSQRDLYHAALSSLLQPHPEASGRLPARVSVEKAMSKTLHTIAPDQPLRAAVKTMLREQIGCLPVVEHGKLVGLLSESDCLRHLSDALGVADQPHAHRDVEL